MRRGALFVLVVTLGAVLSAGPALAGGGGGGGCHSDAITDGSGTAVTIEEGCFGPTVLRVETGQKITFTNGDPYDHVVVGQGWGTSDMLKSGDSATFRFEKPGTYAYSCYLHPGMNGAVVVGSGRSGTTVGSVFPVTTIAPSPPAQAAPAQAAPVSVVAGESAAPWKVSTGILAGLLLGAVAFLMVERVRRGRSRSPVGAPVRAA